MNNIVLVNLTRYNSTKDMCRFGKAENIKDDKKLIILYSKKCKKMLEARGTATSYHNG